MAAIVNARDARLRASSVRLNPVTLPTNVSITPDQIPGLPEYFSSAKEVDIRATSQVFIVPAQGQVMPTSISLSAILKNITGVPTFTVLSGVVTYTVSGTTLTIFAGGLTSDSAVIEVSISANPTVYTDKITLIRATENSNVVNGFLTDEKVVLATNATGAVLSDTLANNGGTFKVYHGSLDKTGSGVVYSVPSSTGMSVSIAQTGVYTINSISADTASVTLRAVYNGTTIDKTFSATKSISVNVGQRGTVNIAKAIAGTAWLDSEAVTALSDAGYGVPQVRDIVTLYNISTGFSQSKFYNGAAWLTLDAYVNGNMLVDGTVAARHLAADSVTASKIDVVDLAAVSANLGSVQISSSGKLKSANVSDFNSGTGIFIGYSGNDYKMHVGVPGGKGLFWDGANLSLNGVLTAGAINAVNTINLAGNSVTVAQVNNATAGVVGNSAYQNILGVSVTVPYDGYYLVTAAMRQSYSGSTQFWRARLIAAGYTLFTCGGQAGYSDSVALMGAIYLGAGSHYVYIDWQGEPSMTVLDRTISVVAAMK